MPAIVSVNHRMEDISVSMDIKACDSNASHIKHVPFVRDQQRYIHFIESRGVITWDGVVECGAVKA